MPEEIDLTEEEEEDLDKVCDEDDEEDEEMSSSSHVLLSVDAHGREHAPAGSAEGGQFISTRRKRRRVVEIVLQGSDAQKTKEEGKEEPKKIEEVNKPPISTKGLGYVHLREHKKAVKKAIEKLMICPLPTDEEIEAARAGVAKKGANKYRKDLIGNTRNRRDRRNKLLAEFGDGKTCPCVYCGEVITHGTMEQDKIYTTLEGGRYRVPNLIPSCEACNKKRGDMPFAEAMKKVVSYVRHQAEASIGSTA